ncbi:glycosyltransferase 87 family protein [Kitasatospora sp. RB6PN24]|uniref:glycosyltransferase 87 family protein n=1 Tax=Kitasatospora humi TaxID=2893891 RepID=UPI001E5CBC78|nr:glycosyltransferase 87 family protein [Kitasatospora humi]MCC9308547.1 glycosyltransferase 87 family protein [Kitasatospora humi]
MRVVQEDERTVPTAPRPAPSPAGRWRPWVTAPVRAVREAPRKPMWIAGALAAVSLFGYALARHLIGTGMVDMIVYRAEGDAVVHHLDLYGLRVTAANLPATYPPFAALLFVPTTWFSVSFLRVAVTGGNVALLALAALFSFRLTDWPRRELRPVGVVLAAGLGVWLEPVYTDLRYGQINLLLLCLVLWDLNVSRERGWKGVGIGIAAGMKLTPGLFAVYLLVTGRIRAAVTAGATFLATFAVSALVLPDASKGFWTKYLYDSSRVGRTDIVDNQSLRGIVARFEQVHVPGPEAALPVAVIAVAGLAVAALLWRDNHRLPRAEAWGACCTAVTALLVSPISWTHHWVWCVPLLVLLAAEADHERTRPAAVRRRRWRPIFVLTLLGFCSFGMWLVPHVGIVNLRLSLVQQLPAGLYVWIGLCFLTVAAMRVRGRRSAVGRPVVPQPRTASRTPRPLVAPRTSAEQSLPGERHTPVVR